MSMVIHATNLSPRVIVIAGPNGAGKTTFAREYLPKDAGVVHFFHTTYRHLANSWAVYENSGSVPRLLETGP